jgi:protein-disulfide isomerase
MKGVDMANQSRFQTVLDTATSVATLTAALAIVWTVSGYRTSGSAPPFEPPPRGSAPTAAVTRLDGPETSLGASHKRPVGAKIGVIEFSDFECPFCGRYARETYPRVMTELVDKGIASYSFRHFPLESIHKSALKASEASECAGQQGKFWGMHDLLFADQKQLSEMAILSQSTKLGLDGSRFRACLSGQMISRIREDQAEAKRFGINGTPSFLVGVLQPNGGVKVVRKFSGAQPFETFESIVKEVLSEL